MNNPTDTYARMSVFMCGPGRPKNKKLFNCQTCLKQRSEFRCQQPVDGAGTCDRHLCKGCSVRVAEDLRICPGHAA